MSEQDRKVGPYLGPRRFIAVTEGEKVLEQRDAEARMRAAPMPTPLYVTSGGRKKITLGYSTQAEADLAERLLSELANAHADRTRAEHQQEIDEARAQNKPLLSSNGQHRWDCPCDECEKL